MNVISSPNMTTTNPVAHCSDCGYPCNAHPVVNSFEHCTNRFDNLDADGMYDVDYDLLTTENLYHLEDNTHRTDEHGIPFIRYEGTGTDHDNNWWDEFAPDFAREDVKVGSSLDRYIDREPDMVTVTIDQYRQGKRPKVEQPTDQRNAYVENEAGYLTVTVWDDTLTRLLHARMLNVFRSKGQLRCGSMSVTHNADQTVTVTCVKCQTGHTFNYKHIEANVPVPYGVTPYMRSAMEEFTLAVIRHGNNHSAKWLRESGRWYKIHTANCDHTCQPDDAACRTRTNA